ncbi:MAG: hypothetical protein AAF320_04480 [Myxococcota bacterium]
MKWWLGLFCSVLLCTLFGCGGDGRQESLVVVLDGYGDSSVLQAVPFPQTSDVRVLQTPHVSMWSDVHFDQAEMFLFRREGGFGDFASFYQKAQSQISQDPARPNLQKQGDKWVPQDFDSLVLVSALYHLENVISYFLDVVKDDSGATKSPLHVGVYPDISTLGQREYAVADNASYSFLLDMIFLRQLAVQRGVPYNMNPAVLAHEFQHRVFHYNVWNKGEKARQYYWEKIRNGKDLLDTRSKNLLDATDEGLADLYAIGFVQDPSAFRHVFKGTLSAFRRDLNGQFAQQANYDALARLDDWYAKQWRCGYAINFQESQKNWNKYCLGTVVSRALWEASGRDFVVLREQLLPLVNASLQDMGLRIVEQGRYDVNLFFNVVISRAVKENMQPMREQLCLSVWRRFRSLYDPLRVPACFF